jgi:hypothetical protein
MQPALFVNPQLDRFTSKTKAVNQAPPAKIKHENQPVGNESRARGLVVVHGDRHE